MATTAATLRKRLPVVDAEVLEPLPARWRPPEETVGPPDEEIFAPRPQTDRRHGSHRWLTGVAVLGALAAYPAMVVGASGIGDATDSVASDRGTWTVAWAGAAVDLLQPQYEVHGWAADARGWSPMARLTAKPAFQSALAESVGEFLAMKAGPEGAPDRDGGDLAAAVRLVNSDSAGVQLRAAVDALHSHDNRLRRRGGADDEGKAGALATLNLVDGWAEVSKINLAQVSAMADGAPLDRAATEAVYAAKARARAAYAFLSTLDWPEDASVRASRTEALAAWRAAAEFHPVIVLNASPESTLLGNHPVAMGFLVARAQTATERYAVALSGEDLEPTRY